MRLRPWLGNVDDLTVTLEAKPNRLGKNLFNIRLVSAVPEASPLARVSLEFRYNGEEREPVTVAEEVETNLLSGDG
ncbi:MAG: hypothetical protein R2867_39825 [Caldilineaceae bacterium]